MYVGRGAVGGSLSLTDSELRFFGGDNLHMPLREISAVRVARQSWWHPRKTVQIETRDGQAIWFLVNRQEEVAQRITESARTAGAEVSTT
jgi:hypothetical protein